MSEEVICLGIESTAHAFSVGVASSMGKLLACAGEEYVPERGGIHPREAARFQALVAGMVVSKAIKESGVDPSDLNVIAFAQGPGLGPCLRTGATIARALSVHLGVPLVGVNHCVAHIEVGKLLTKTIDPLTLYVSGGNTIVAAYEAGKYRVFGETLDIAVGNCLDAFARRAGLPHPGGPHVERLAKRGGKLLPLPYIVKGMDLSFSGLLTSAVKCLKRERLEDVCFSLQEIAFSMLAEVTERAVAHTEKTEVLLTGGVAANKRLQEMISSVAREHGASFHVVPKKYATDNGAMIAWTGVLAFKCGQVIPVEESFIRQRWRLDDAHVPWVEVR
jgi:N6-L-threonylcarbamoyladenine synthase/protein kinase Bud32